MPVYLRVSDLRQFLVLARPAMAAREFVLMTTFPNKDITDESQTLQEANLLNAVIVQRLNWGWNNKSGPSPSLILCFPRPEVAEKPENTDLYGLLVSNVCCP